MRTDIKVGIIGMAYFFIGALMVGKSLNVLSPSATLGVGIMVVGLYISGYFAAMEPK